MAFGLLQAVLSVLIFLAYSLGRRQCYTVVTSEVMDGLSSLFCPSLFHLPRGQLIFVISSRSSWIVDCLLLLAGDVALNPGPFVIPVPFVGVQ